ncbi:MAG: M12 family metallo-peptidase [Methanosarcina sp.]
MKFANNRLPNYLEGTILDSNQRVIASENGKPPENLKEGEDYDIIITHEKMFAIIHEEREKYIQNYGVDPENPKIEIINNYAIPKEEINKLAESGKISFEINTSEKQIQNDPELISNALFSTLSVSSNPYAIDEIINEYIFVAKDSRHKPTEAITQDTHDALYRFEDFGIGVNTYWYWNSWDASDVSPADSSSSALTDLKEDTNWVRDSANDMVIGWTHNMDHNGIAYECDITTKGPFAICSDTATGLDWPHDSIVQHEVSHNFDESDQNSVLHPTCIMNEPSAYAGTNAWCTACGNTVQNGIDN